MNRCSVFTNVVVAIVLSFSANIAVAGKYDISARFNYESRHDRALSEVTQSCYEKREKFLETYLDFISTLDNEKEKYNMTQGMRSFVVTPEPVFPAFTDPKFSKESRFFERIFTFLHHDIKGILYQVQQLEQKVTQYGKDHGVSKEESLEAVLLSFEKRAGIKTLVIETECPSSISGRFMPADAFEAGMKAWEKPEIYDAELKKGVCGLLSPQQFLEIVRRGFGFIDFGASKQHGSHSHRIHWYLIGNEFLDHPEDFMIADDLAKIKNFVQKYAIILEMYKMVGNEDLLQTIDWTRSGNADYLEDRKESETVGPIKRNKNGRDIYGTPFLTNDHRRLELPNIWFHLIDTFRISDASNASFFGFSQKIGCFKGLPEIGRPPDSAIFYDILNFKLK